MTTIVPELAEELIAALNVVMDVNASRENRARANQVSVICVKSFVLLKLIQYF